MTNRLSALTRDVLASPLGDVIAAVGAGVASAQRALDEASIAQSLEIWREGGDDMLRMLREIGYRPTFYALPETTGEVTVSLRLSGSEGMNQTGTPPTSAATGQPSISKAIASRATPRVASYVTPVDATFANRYSYNATMSTKLTFKIVPIPPPEGVDQLRVVPQLSGRTLSEAVLVLEMLELAIEVTDRSGTVVESPLSESKVKGISPPPDSVVPTGSLVRLEI